MTASSTPLAELSLAQEYQLVKGLHAWWRKRERDIESDVRTYVSNRKHEITDDGQSYADALDVAQIDGEQLRSEVREEAVSQLTDKLCTPGGTDTLDEFCLERAFAAALVEDVIDGTTNLAEPAETVGFRRGMAPGDVQLQAAQEDPALLVADWNAAYERNAGDPDVPDARRTASKAVGKQYGLKPYVVDEIRTRHEKTEARRGADRFEGRRGPATATPSSIALGVKPPDPRWLVRGYVKPGRVHITSGDTHVGKTLLTWAMMGAGMRGEPFLGRSVDVERWIVVDAENAREDLERIWTALGITQAMVDKHVRLFDAQELGVALGEPDWDDYIEAQARDFGAQAMVLDTLPAVAAVDLLDNSGVVDLYRRTLKPLARRLDLAILGITHEHKNDQRGGRRDQRVLGARQWVAQADALFTVGRVHEQTQEPEADGIATRSVIALWREKMRPEGPWPKPEHVEFTGKLAEQDGALLSLQVQLASDVTDAELLVGLVRTHGAMPKGKLAEHSGWSRTASKFQNALNDALEAGHLFEREEGRQKIIDTNTEA